MQVRFAGKSWLVRKTSAEGFILEPIKVRSRGEAVDFIYPGGGIGFDAFLCNRMWKILHSEPIKRLMAEELYRDFHAFRTRLVGTCGPEQIPYVEVERGYRYFTFWRIPPEQSSGSHNESMGIQGRRYFPAMRLTYPVGIDPFGAEGLRICIP